MHGWRADIAAARGESKPENLLYVMFAHTDTSQAKGLTTRSSSGECRTTVRCSD
jgi:hypothetical protein